MPDRALTAPSGLTWRDVCEDFLRYRRSARLYGLRERFDELASATPDHATVDAWARLRAELDALHDYEDEFVGKNGAGIRRRTSLVISAEGDHACPTRLCDRRAFGGLSSGAPPRCELLGKQMVADDPAHLESSHSSSDVAR